MDKNAEAAVHAAIKEMASDMKATWDSPLNWAATTDALVELIADIGGKVEPVHFSTLVAAAAMAMRQSSAVEQEASHG